MVKARTAAVIKAQKQFSDRIITLQSTNLVVLTYGVRRSRGGANNSTNRERERGSRLEGPLY